jgi:hypothetical protein
MYRAFSVCSHLAIGAFSGEGFKVRLHTMMIRRFAPLVPQWGIFFGLLEPDED